MNAMITRRAFTKTLGGAAALATFCPVLGWALDEPKVSADAAKLYHDSFILDGNALAWIGSLLGRSNQDDITKVIRESGVTALKSTLGGAVGDFAAAVTDIAAAEQLMEKRADLFLKVRTPGSTIT
jgi:membrane dipeptidase